MEDPATISNASQTALELLSRPGPNSDEEKDFSQGFRDLLSSLPTHTDLFQAHAYQYHGFWFPPNILQVVIDFRRQFQSLDTDVLLVTAPKSGTTWLKALTFTLVNRSVHPPRNNDHPLLTQNPHDLVKFFVLLKPSDYSLPYSSTTTRRIFACHTPFVALPESVKDESSTCKTVYMCRGIKDTFISLYHFIKKIMPNKAVSLEEALELFTRGLSVCGPIWDHILGYWEESLKRPHRVLFIKYEDMKREPALHLRRLASFLDCPFSEEEENSGMVDGILNLCSFDHMSGLEVNKTRKSAFFRKGEVGDWHNSLTDEMATKLDNITRQKFHGSGLYNLD